MSPDRPALLGAALAASSMIGGVAARAADPQVAKASSAASAAGGSAVFSRDDQRLTAKFVEGVLVQYSISSKSLFRSYDCFTTEAPRTQRRTEKVAHTAASRETCPRPQRVRAAACGRHADAKEDPEYERLQIQWRSFP